MTADDRLGPSRKPKHSVWRLMGVFPCFRLCVFKANTLAPAPSTAMQSQRICQQCKRVALKDRRLYSTASPTRDYRAAVQALNSLQSNFSIVEAIRKMGPGWNKLAVPEMIGWARRIGYEPSDFDVLNPIHIAGTKGKGSTSSFISSILTRYIPTKRSINAERLPSSVGLYTSPHLRFVRERIKIDNVPIDEDLFAKYFWEVWDRLEATPPPIGELDARGNGGKPVYFHYLTLMALHCYMQQSVGTAVVECGIGGEYDTTNILANPTVTGVTSLGIDHEALLGDTIESIAWHKSGIFKENVPAFSVPQPETAMSVLQARAKEKKTGVHFVPQYAALRDIELGLQGDYQKINASLAVAVCISHLSRLGFTNNLDPLDPQLALPEEFVAGLHDARLGGRCDLRQDTKSPNLTWCIDGGHTLESIDVAGRWFASTTQGVDQDKPIRILLFNQQTRDASSLARRLHTTLANALHDARPFTHAIFCPNTTYRTAGYRPDLVSMNTSKDDVGSLRVQHDLAKTWDQIDPEATVHVLSSIEEAVERARDISNGRKAEVLATGSLHLVGGLIEVIESELEAGSNGRGQ
nr:folylpolyglutamate synthase [Quercus suber]